ncbi:unnamed protein product [Ceratitis capitata]|uniref:(Mediterranean fruit fly) hypothetical protein n=1 Tax=Ceratitis capitata TaxID=7213 RepID=A0A811U1K2_CERCA|nr:unnamed protein product [Ceratitis capitata]
MRPLPPELARIAREELNETPERITQDLVILRTWIYQQRYLHARISADFLIAFLRRCRYSLEETKKRIDDFFTFITRFPEISALRRVNAKMLTINRLVLPELPRCSDHAAIMITRVGCCPKRYHMREIMACNIMGMEVFALENDNAAIAGVCQIFDMSNLTIEHTAQLDGGLFRKWWYWMSECCPLRINVTYCLNAPKKMQKWLGLLKTVCHKMNPTNQIYMIKSLDELYQYIPRKCLPEEYGGSNDEVNYGTAEQLRPGEIMPFEAEFGAEGSFRQLIVD